VRRGHQVRIVTAGMPHLPLESEEEEGIEVRRLRAFRRREDTCSVPEMAAWVMRAIPAAIAEVHRWKPDVIHAHFAVPTGAVAWAVHKVTGVPYVLTAHLGDVPGGVPEQTGNLFRWIKPFTVPIWRDAAATTAVSSFVAGLANDAYGVRPKIILNGIELPATPELKRPEIPRLLMVGRMSVQKNPLAAVRALALLKDLPWTMSVIGDGPLLAGIRTETERLGLASRIEFRGWATAAEVSAEMGNSSILLMPSLSEGLPMVAVEALTHGIAIVGSRIGGLSDVVEEGGNGRLFELDSGAEGLARALKPLLEDPVALLRAREASLAMMPRFDLEGALDAYEQVLNDVSK
jgi:glycosyltransferase involved in cell wall biosynthesis